MAVVASKSHGKLRFPNDKQPLRIFDLVLLGLSGPAAQVAIAAQQGLSHEQIAARLGCSRENVTMRLRTVRRRLPWLKWRGKGRPAAKFDPSGVDLNNL